MFTLIMDREFHWIVLTSFFLQGKQAEFVSICIDHLLVDFPKIILIGYSMGGLVVDRVLQDGKVNSRILMSITIGSPHFHLPSFLSPAKVPKKSAIPNYEVPTVHILSGPGDLQVPATSAWSAYSSQTLHNTMTFEVDTDNIPGVWTTSSHKGLVSCNQLVRKIVPLILDSILMDSQGKSSTNKIYRRMRETLTSNTTFGIQMISKENEVKKNQTNKPYCMPVSHPVFVHEFDARRRPGQSCFSWHVGDSPKSDALFQIAIHGLKPGRDISVFAAGGNTVFDITDLFSPLPSLSIAEPAENRRFWQEVIQGIDWMQNATWIVEIYSEALLKADTRSLEIMLESQQALLTVQSFSVVLTSEKERTMHQTETLQNHTVIKVNLPRMFQEYFRVGIKVLSPHISWRKLAWIVPLRLSLETKICSGISREQSIMPLFILKNGSQEYPSDHIWKNREDHGMPLWHPACIADSVFLLVDPRCQYSTSMKLDVLSAVSYSIRYQIYSLPGLLLASSILRLVPVSRRGMKFVPESPNLNRYGLHCLMFAVQAVILSRMLHFWQAGSIPWLFILNPVAILSILCASFCLDVVIKAICCGCFNIMNYMVPRKAIPKIRWETLSTVLMMTVCVLHDFLPFYFSLLYTYACLQGLSMHPTDYSSVEWYLILLYGVGPMVVAMSGGKIIGYRSREKYGFTSLERLLLIFISFASKRRRNSPQKSYPWRRPARILLSNTAMFTSLFGYNFIPPYVVAILCLDEIF